MNRLDLLFDPKQFLIVFGAATYDSSAEFEKSQLGARHEDGVAVTAAELLRGCQEARRDVQLKRGEK